MVTPMVTANTPVSLACALSMPASLLDLPVMPCRCTRHRTSAIDTHHRKQQVISRRIIEQYSFATETWVSYTKLLFCISRICIIDCYTLCIYMIWYFYGRFLVDQGKRRFILTFSYVFTSVLVCPIWYMVLYPCRYMEKQPPVGVGGVCAARRGGSPIVFLPPYEKPL